MYTCTSGKRMYLHYLKSLSNLRVEENPMSNGLEHYEDYEGSLILVIDCYELIMDIELV